MFSFCFFWQFKLRRVSVERKLNHTMLADSLNRLRLICWLHVDRVLVRQIPGALGLAHWFLRLKVLANFTVLTVLSAILVTSSDLLQSWRFVSLDFQVLVEHINITLTTLEVVIHALVSHWTIKCLLSRFWLPKHLLGKIREHIHIQCDPCSGTYSSTWVSVELDLFVPDGSAGQMATTD